MKKMINIAVIGCGRVAQHYKKIFDSGVISSWKFVGFFDIVSERSKVFSDHFNTDSFASFEEMLEATNHDLLLILTPSGLHYEHTKVAFEYGCNVLLLLNGTAVTSNSVFSII